MAASRTGTAARATPPRLVLEVGGLSFTALSEGEGDLVLLIHGFPDGPVLIPWLRDSPIPA